MYRVKNLAELAQIFRTLGTPNPRLLLKSEIALNKRECYAYNHAADIIESTVIVIEEEESSKDEYAS